MSLVKERGGVRAVVTKECDKVKGLLSSDITAESITQLRVSLNKLATYEHRLTELDQKVFATFGEDKEDLFEAEMAKTFEYNDAILETSPSASEKPTATVKLPKLEIAKYDGSPLGWQTFWDEFSNSIDRHDGLSDIDKFNYLKKYLTGDAAKVVDGYRLTAANYQVVTDVLKERFGNKQRAIFAHIEAMLAIPESNHDVDKLQSTSDECEKHIRSLVALGLSEQTFSQFFAPIMLSKLPKYVKIELHRKNGSQEWTLDNIREWLKDEVRARELGSQSFKNGSEPPSKENGNGNGYRFRGATRGGAQPFKKTTAAALVSSANKVKCAYCDGEHYSDACSKFVGVAARRTQCDQHKMCFNCLGKGHSIKKCRRKGVCVHCNRSGHHRSLCLAKFGSGGGCPQSSGHSSTLNFQASPFVPQQNEVTYAKVQRAPSTRRVSFSDPPAATQTVTVAHTECTVLETAITNVRNTDNGQTTWARLLFDTAGSRTFITETKQRELGLRVVRTEWISVSGFQSQKRKTNKFRVVELAVVCRDGSTQMITASVVPTITCPIQKLPLDLSALPNAHLLPLAEPLVSNPEFVPVDILIGGDYYYDFVLTNRIHCPNGPILLESKLGYISAGRVPASFVGPETVAVMLLSGNPTVVSAAHSSFDIQRYWELEDIGLHDKSPDPSADETAIASFNASVKFEQNRYQVCWPWKTENPEISDNLPLAKGRLRSLLRRLRTDDGLQQAYEKTFTDQIGRGIIEEAPKLPDSDRVYYMPHHPIVKPDKATTKVRVVFDASSKLNRDVNSLNDCVYRGPVFLEDLCGLLIRTRLHKVLVISDIEKAFHMIGLQPSDRDVTRFLWVRDYSRPLTDDNIIIYRFARVPFGVVSSPFLLGATIQYHLQQADTETAQKILRGLYVDNVITGFDNEDGAIQFYGESKSLFAKASLNLREWYTNSAIVRDSLQECDQGASTNPKILGLRWNTDSDTIGCTFAKAPSNKPPTKRIILGTISSFYDPCGFFSPVTVMGKILVQDLRKDGIGWDDEVSNSIQFRWEKICKEIEVISVSDIPRFVGSRDNDDVELHVFCDASQRAYSAVVYLKVGSNPGNVHLLFSRCRLAPIKHSLTIPRLELTAVCVGVRAMRFVESQIDRTVKSKTVWTDSQCTQSRDISFRYVGTKSNPADLPTRGCSADQLMKDTLWWHGPSWLVQDSQLWPEVDPSTTIVPSETTPAEAVLVSPAFSTIIEIGRFSCLQKLLRTTAWLFRFVHNARSLVADKKTESLSGQEISNALVWWIKEVQRQYFPELYDRNDKTWVRGIGRQLQIFEDSQGILRCGGRLENTSLPYSARHPVLLPPKCHFSRLIVMGLHRSNYHAGTGHTLASLRQEYWVIRGRSFVRSVLHECNQCRRAVGGPFRIPDMPSLPSSRTELTNPFENVGIDHFGPLWVKEKDEKTKVWGCIFVCMVSRAIHIELVESLSANSFLMAFRRFCATYTVPKLIMSDNSTTFRSADRALQLLWSNLFSSDELQAFLAGRSIQWKFVVEYASWMGGFYERLIGIVKQCLKRTLFSICLTKMELVTVFAEIAQVVNCRPLVYVEDDSQHGPLRPIDLLGSKDRRVLPLVGEIDEFNPLGPSTAQGLLSNWRRLQKVSENFWSTWHKEYLTSLRERQHTAKQRNCSDLEPTLGRVVLIKDSVPRNQWKLGKIAQVHQSKDGQIRSATVELASGKKVQRPIKLLYPLEATAARDPQSHSPDRINQAETQKRSREAAQVARQNIAAQLDDSESESE